MIDVRASEASDAVCHLLVILARLHLRREAMPIMSVWTFGRRMERCGLLRSSALLSQENK